jgi:hypothetical protein
MVATIIAILPNCCVIGAITPVLPERARPSALHNPGGKIDLREFAHEWK